MTPSVDVRGLNFAYDHAQALRNVSFSIEPGECVGLVGPNGAGKSTLLLHLNGILPEELGDRSAVVVDGIPVTRKNVLDVRRRVGLLFQDPDDQLFCPTVYDDVAFGPLQQDLPDDAVRSRVEDALAKVRLEGFARRAPQHLSLGEKRRVCLAGVLACSPSILVLDEPTSGLDPRGRRELAALLHTLSTTRIVASHDLDLIVTLCSRVLLLDAGTLVANGPTRDVLGDESLMFEHGLEKPHSLLHAHPHPCGA
ncbi:MAG: energy-coupling factor ABC transporter ATP-binding protein [Vicinamibacterales bacterium]